MGKRAVIVTGAASGIGKGIAEKFTASGDDVLLVDIKEQQLNETKEQLAAAFPNAVIKAATGDLTSMEFVECVAAECKAAFGRADVLVNCAGIFPSTPFLQISRYNHAKIVPKLFPVKLQLSLQRSFYLSDLGSLRFFCRA